jgi:glycopeptide antibiotics resistance protein
MMRPEKKISRQIHIYPLWTFVEMIKTGKLMFLWLSIENIMMFIPLGFAIETGMSDYQSKKRKVIAVFCASLVSLCIEIIQYRFNVGNCDVEDWINNTLGALIGVLCAEAIKKHKYGEFE